MTTPTVALILTAAFLHACWNLLLKWQPDRIVGLNLQLFSATFVAAAAAIYFGPPEPVAWFYIIPGALLHLLYHVCLLNAYRLADMNLAYPIFRGSAPLLAVLIAFVFLSETPSPTALGGIVILCGGILMLTKGTPRLAVIAALATAVVIASYSVLDAQGARLNGNGLQYAVWLMMLDSAFFLPLALRQRGWRALWKAPAKCRLAGAIGGFCSVTAYGLVTVAYTQAPIGSVAALRETSIIIAAIMGYYLLGEKKALRIPAACVVALGAALIVGGG